MRVIGLMSGTSYDAIDAAAAELTLEGEDLTLRPLGMVGEAYDGALREALAAALPPAVTLAEVCRLDTLIGQAFAAAAVRLDRELCGGAAELVASHGRPSTGLGRGRAGAWTLQLGQPAWIAEATGLPVVASFFRPRGHRRRRSGTPLVSLVDLLWLRGRAGTPVALNLGGIANLTAPDGTAFDSGPGAPSSTWPYWVLPGPLNYDMDGALQPRGTVHEPLLDRLSTGAVLRAARAEDHRQGALPPRPSARRAERLRHAHRRGRHRDPHPAHRPYGRRRGALGGCHGGHRVRGGTRNPALMAMLDAELPECPCARPTPWACRPAKEAYAFAALGFLTLHRARAPIRRAPVIPVCPARSRRGAAGCGCRRGRERRRCDWSWHDTRWFWHDTRWFWHDTRRRWCDTRRP